MVVLKKIKKIDIHIIITFLIGLIINQYVGNRGIFPIDSFSHFDTGYRVLNGEFPFRDYWAVSGPFLDFFQSFLYSMFGVTWQTYLLNGSILNGLITALSFKLFLELKLKKKYALFYSICIAILAYPVSATPFVDLHSTYLSLIAIFFFIFGTIKEKKKYFFFVPIFLFLAFLSKQVPSTYIFLSLLIVLFYYFIIKNPNIFEIIKTFFLSSIICLIFFFLIIYLKEINFKNFADQYINYPRDIGKLRYLNLKYDFKNLFLNFKFIYIIFLPYFLTIIYKIINLNNFYKTYNFIIFLIFFLLIISLIHHQLLTRNQIFIFFLIPYISALFHTEIISLNLNKKKIIVSTLIIFCIFITVKYSFRYNLDRKFHELNNVDFSNGIEASIIDKKFKNLIWITPGKINKEQVQEEIDVILNTIKILKNDNENKMIFTNYSIFSVILEQSQNSISRWFPHDNSGFPEKGQKYYENYKDLLIKNLKRKKIINIYLFKDINEKNLKDYIPKSCLEKVNDNEVFIKFTLIGDCQEFN